MDVIYGNIDEYNPTKKHKILIAFNDIIADMLTHKKLFIRTNKKNSILIFIMQSYFAVLKNIRLNSTYYFVIKL